MIWPKMVRIRQGILKRLLSADLNLNFKYITRLQWAHSKTVNFHYRKMKKTQINILTKNLPLFIETTLKEKYQNQNWTWMKYAIRKITIKLNQCQPVSKVYKCNAKYWQISWSRSSIILLNNKNLKNIMNRIGRERVIQYLKMKKMLTSFNLWKLFNTFL